MLRRLWRSALWGVGLGIASWIVSVAAILMNSIVPWWVPVSVGLFIFVVEFVTEPLFSEEGRQTRREAAREAALAELEAQMKDESDGGLTRG